MKYYLLILIAFSILSCHQKLDQFESHPKINFDFSALDDKGLMGPQNGKVAVSYEFCIPKKDQYKNEIKAIDASVQFSKSRGRIGCSKNEYLCIGTTGKEYKKVFSELVKKEYIKRIDQTFFE